VLSKTFLHDLGSGLVVEVVFAVGFIPADRPQLGRCESGTAGHYLTMMVRLVKYSTERSPDPIGPYHEGPEAEDPNENECENHEQNDHTASPTARQLKGDWCFIIE